MSDTDGLYDTSEEAIRQRLARLGLPRRPIVECPMERAMMGLICAVEELDGVLLLARSPEALAEVRGAATDAIKRLMAIQAVAWELEAFAAWEAGAALRGKEAPRQDRRKGRAGVP